MIPFDAVCFDLGDTLVDLGEGRGSYEARLAMRVSRVYDVLAQAGVAPADRQAFCHALATSSEARYHQAVAEQRGIDISDVLRWFFAHHGIPADDGLIEAAAEAYCRGSGEVTPLRVGAREVLNTLRDHGLRLAVISNTLQPARYLDESLARRGLLEYFPVRVYSSEVRVAKPHPAIFRAALAALNVRPERAVYVGDRLVTDVAGAQGVGMKAVLIEVPQRIEQVPHIVPDARIRELPELLAVLPRLDT
jgi:putative hydrolase of the HAD superfamily